jgi:hypothetical protein
MCLPRARSLSWPQSPLRLVTDTTKKKRTFAQSVKNSPYFMEPDSSLSSLQNISNSPILSQTNPTHNLPFYLCKTHFSIILPPTSRSSEWSLSFNFPCTLGVRCPVLCVSYCRVEAAHTFKGEYLAQLKRESHFAATANDSNNQVTGSMQVLLCWLAHQLQTTSGVLTRAFLNVLRLSCSTFWRSADKLEKFGAACRKHETQYIQWGRNTNRPP